MYELTDIRDFDDLSDEVIDSSDLKSREKIEGIIRIYLESGDMRLESIIEGIIEYNEQIFYLMADYMVKNDCMDIDIDEDDDEVYAQAMDYFRDRYLGYSAVDLFENIIYETVTENEIPLIIDLESFSSFDILTNRVSTDAREIDTDNLSDDVCFHINHAQTIMFDMEDCASRGGCWHYGSDNILMIDKGRKRKPQLLIGG